MADLNQILAQLFGAGEQEQPNLSPGAPYNAPGSGGIFRRRPMSGNPALPLAMPPEWASRLSGGEMNVLPEPEPPHPFPFPLAAGPDMMPPPAPYRTGRTRPMGVEHPGGYSNFADYSRGQDVARLPAGAQRLDPPQASPGPRRGLEPPTAPVARTDADMEQEAWNAAVGRARGQLAVEGHAARRRLPRPGQPLVSQAWADPAGGMTMGGLVGLKGRVRQSPASRTGRR